MATRDIKPADPTIDPLTGEFRVLSPGWSFKSVTEKISDIVLTPKTSLGWFAVFGVGGSVAVFLLVAVTGLLSACIVPFCVSATGRTLVGQKK